MNTNPFLKRIMKDEAEDVVHSSAYARAQNQTGIGAASSEGFAHRMAVDQRRTFVKRYGDSRVVNNVGDGVPRAKRYEPAKQSMQQGAQQGVGRPAQPIARRNPGISR